VLFVWSRETLRELRQTSEPVADINAVVGGYLRDLAYVQPSRPQMFGYKRAAAAVLALDTPLIDH